MKLAVFGGTGKAGQHFVQQALAAGHEVIALARTPAKMATQHAKLQVVQGDILDAGSVAKVVAGADAVVSLLGPSSNAPEFTVSKGMDNILSAMRQHNVERIVITAGAGVRDPQDKPKFIDRFAGLLLNLISKNVVADMKQVVEKVRTSDRAWTVVRVPMLTDQPARGTFKVGYVGDITPRLSRADMATFVLKQLDEGQFVRKAPAISN